MRRPALPRPRKPARWSLLGTARAVFVGFSVLSLVALVAWPERHLATTLTAPAGRLTPMHSPEWFSGYFARH